MSEINYENYTIRTCPNCIDVIVIPEGLMECPECGCELCVYEEDDIEEMVFSEIEQLYIEE